MKDVDAQNFTVSIGKADPAVTVDTPQNIVCGVGTFTEPDVKGVDGAELTGSVSYTYGGQTYASTAALTAVLDTLDGGATGTISYTFTPNSANYTTAWYYDSTCHWHECSCGDKSNIGQHISNGGIVTVQPTATSTGLRVYSCSVCGYVLRTETIPATGYNYPSYPTYPTYSTYVPPVITTPSVFTTVPEVDSEVNGSTVTLKWDEIKNADKYYVYQYKDGKYVKVKTTTDTTVTFKNMKNGETYKFLVRYTIKGKLSPTSYSGKITVKVYYKPLPKATASKNSIKLTWEAVPEAEKYAIYKYVDGKAVKLTETKKLSVKIGKLIPDTEYKYIVRAYVDGKWTTMLKSDIVTVKTKAE